MSAEHTKGPWRVEEGTTLIWGNCDPDDKSTYGMGYPIARCEFPRHWNPRCPSEDERIANAALIAAAPDLLFALRLILPLAKGYAAEHRVGSNAECVEAALAALAKAEPAVPEGE